MKTFATKILILAVFCAAAKSQAYDIYSNTNTDLGYNFSLGTSGIVAGDEFVPASGGFLEHIDIQYYLSNASGNESVQVWLYENSGPDAGLINRTALEPSSTALFDSGPFNIGAFGSTTRSTLNYDAGLDFAANSILISGTYNLTLAIQFSGIESGEDAGVSLYDYPTVPGPSGNYNSYWEYDGANWAIKTNSSTPNGFVDFGMHLSATAVPEPSMISFAMMGGLLALGFAGIFRRR